MKKILISLLLINCHFLFGQDAIPRKDAFFGLHFDLHANKHDSMLNADVTEERVAQLLESVRPDYVQYDCKGHPGYTSYPTDIGYTCPGIKKDALAIWRKVTKKYGVGLYIHYSGILDRAAVEHHPEWASVDVNGDPYPRGQTSVFSPYVDEYMIPQLKEVVSRYDLDGLWIDGDCWGTTMDYGQDAIKVWKLETGYTDVPKDRSDPRWFEWKMFHRRAFERYLAHWVDELHAFRPGLDITSNWMYTTYAPKPVTVDLDFISGDYSALNSVTSARLNARYIASTGMPWDLMAWGFNRTKGVWHTWKTPIQLMQEAAVVLMQGGGFQVYHHPPRTGYLADHVIEKCTQLAEFCRARKAVSFKSQTIPQVAVLLSTETFMHRSDQPERVYSVSHVYDELQGALHALLELHYSVDVLAEYQLENKISEYPLVVLPDVLKLSDGFKSVLLDYVRSGGKLLLLGHSSAKLFESDLGVKFDDNQEENAYVQVDKDLANVNGVWQSIIPTTAQAIGWRYPKRKMDFADQKVAATLTNYGRGQIATVYGPIAFAFFSGHHPYLREFFQQIIETVFPDPMLETNAPPVVDVALRTSAQGQTCIHLLNLNNAPESGQRIAIDAVPAVGPFTVRLKVNKEPDTIKMIPGDLKPGWTWNEGVAEINVPEFDIHSILVLE